MLEYRNTSDRQIYLSRDKKKLRIKSCDVNRISLFLPIASKKKLIVVTPCSTHETAHSRLPIPTKILLHLPVLLVALSHSGYEVPLHVYFRAIER